MVDASFPYITSAVVSKFIQYNAVSTTLYFFFLKELIIKIGPVTTADVHKLVVCADHTTETGPTVRDVMVWHLSVSIHAISLSWHTLQLIYSNDFCRAEHGKMYSSAG